MFLIILLITFCFPLVRALRESLCSFDSTDCGFTVDEPWILTNKIYIPNIFNGPPMQLNKDSRFAAAQGRFGVASEGNLTGPVLPPSDSIRKLYFQFSKSTHSTKMNIILLNPFGSELLDSVIGVGLLQWNPRTVIIPSTKRGARLVFEVIGIENSFDVVAIDDLEIEIDERIHGSGKSQREGGGETRYGGISTRLSRQRDAESPTCASFSCDFEDSFCSWQTSANWVVTEQKVVLEDGEGSLTSLPVLLPDGAHFYVQILMSESSYVTIVSTSGSSEEVLRTGGGDEKSGWTTLALPIRHSSLPTRVVIRASASSGAFVAIRRTRIVDSTNRPLQCGFPNGAIQPLSDATQRLTAVQQLDAEPASIPSSSTPVFASALPIFPSFVSSPGIFPTTAPPVTISPANILTPPPFLFSGEPIPIQSPSLREPSGNPTFASAANIWDTPTKPWDTPTKHWDTPTKQFSQRSDSVTSEKKNHVIIRPSIFRSPTRTITDQEPAAARRFAEEKINSNPRKEAQPQMVFDQKPANPMFMTDQDVPSRQPLVGVPAVPPPLIPYQPLATPRSPIADLIRTVGGTPLGETQLRELAKRFGFPNLSGAQAEKALGLFKEFTKGGGTLPAFPTSNGLNPIMPIGSSPQECPKSAKIDPDNGTWPNCLPEDNSTGELFSSSKIAMLKHIPKQIAEKFGSIFSLPETRLDEARPLTRQHLDFVVQNAYNKMARSQAGI